MSVDIHSEEAQVIRKLIPLSKISATQFEALCDEITIETAERNTYLFSKNDTENDLIYLIEGSVTLKSDNLKIETIKSGTESSRFALAHQIPRKIGAYTDTLVRFLRLDPDNKNIISNVFYEEDTSYMVIDEHEEDQVENDSDWMTTLLKSPIFRSLPPSNLQQILMGLEETTFEKGDYILKQGEPGDFYYIIKKGKCLVSRKPSANAKEIKLAQMHDQDTFGEDSLLSDTPRNANVIALTPVSVFRLDKEKFITLIKEPSLQFINYSQITGILDEGAILVDVRTPDEYKNHHAPKSVNMPFFTLHMQLKLFDKTKPVIIICKNGKTSAAAAFLLLKNKFKAFIVTGGMEQEQEAIEIINEEIVENNIEQQATDSNLSDNIQTEPQSDLNSLELENQQLKLTVKTLAEEKEDLEKKYRLLYKQSTKLKAAFDALKDEKQP